MDISSTLRRDHLIRRASMSIDAVLFRATFGPPPPSPRNEYYRISKSIAVD